MLSNKAFTLIEMSVVIAIIGILYATVVPIYSTTISRAKEAALEKNLNIMRTTIDNYYKDWHRWPESLEELLEKKYIRNIPPCPITGSETNAWQEIPYETGMNNLYDVISTAPGNSLDGKPYSEF